MSLKECATQVLAIVEQGGCQKPDGHWQDISQEIAAARSGTVLYTPAMLADCAAAPQPVAEPSSTIEVTTETTQQAASRLVAAGHQRLAVLNFASARNPGGGFLRGAKAQEEDLARCSTLYDCLKDQRQYYDINRAQPSVLYTDHLIYSPDVPWFRTRSRDDPDGLYLAAVITSPAPNARQAQPRGIPAAAITEVLERRAGHVLHVAKEQGAQTLVLGAWGCGVFGNDPTEVAGIFKNWLTSEPFHDAFETVVFAVYDRSKGKATFAAFREAFN